MLYLLYGDNTFLINKEIENIIDENKIEEIDISKYELDGTNSKDIIDDASTISMFSTNKMIIVDNAYIFGTSKSDDLTMFEEYFSNPNPDTIIIFKYSDIKIDERKKITKIIKQNGTIKEFNKETNIKKLVTSLFDNYKISSSNIDLLINRVGNDIYALQNEIDKIKLYKDNDLNITADDIVNLTCENIDSSLFKLMDAIISSDTEQAIILYRDLVKNNMETIQIVVSLANKYRLMYQTKSLAITGLNEEEIGKELKQNPKYVYMLLKTGRKYTLDSLLDLLKQLADLDYKIKSSNIDKNLAFEFFILHK